MNIAFHGTQIQFVENDEIASQFNRGASFVHIWDSELKKNEFAFSIILCVYFGLGESQIKSYCQGHSDALSKTLCDKPQASPVIVLTNLNQPLPVQPKFSYALIDQSFFSHRIARKSLPYVPRPLLKQSEELSSLYLNKNLSMEIIKEWESKYGLKFLKGFLTSDFG